MEISNEKSILRTEYIEYWTVYNQEYEFQQKILLSFLYFFPHFLRNMILFHFKNNRV